ncbi:hypothetical protein LMG28690_07161 [Paraburkholderia caffeinilytica]|nr:hypothetical protein LMG28690_07161 [Paraburkholderia caffeinilytica]
MADVNLKSCTAYPERYVIIRQSLLSLWRFSLLQLRQLQLFILVQLPVVENTACERNWRPYISIICMSCLWWRCTSWI